MSLLTITSDFGSKDHYLAVLKGQLYSQLETVNIVDITNEIDHYNIPQAAFIVKNSISSFPKNTIHLVLVGSMGRGMDYLIVKHKDQFFIGLNNGVFSLIFEDEPIFAYRINISLPEEYFSFPERYLVTQAAAHLYRGGIPEMIADPVQQIKQSIGYTPIIQDDLIRGSILHIDEYGNIITNITKSIFEMVRRGRSFEIRFRNPRTKIFRVSQQYNEVEGGEIVALFNSSGLLEVAVFEGKANQLLGISITDNLSINFE